ncbi:MAG TPA: glycerophosphodiester phosphodiesterase [Terrimicrobiaceae bacterium]|nr:glycerophosphodiester phosphodiesterase [Terrimicrobiaceae bacterium]
MPGPVEIIAHRGASDGFPENTASAVRAAWNQGADAVEVDVRMTRDGRIVLMHDETALRTAGRDDEVSALTAAELMALDAGSWKGRAHAGERIPRLDEILDLVPDGRRLYIEIKCGSEAVPALRDVCRDRGAEPAQTAFIAFDRSVCESIKRACPDHPVLWIIGRQQRSTRLENLIAECVSSGLDGLDFCADWPINADFVRRVKTAGLAVCVWTVDDPRLAVRLAEAGVDGITTNRPGWLREKMRQT